MGPVAWVWRRDERYYGAMGTNPMQSRAAVLCPMARSDAWQGGYAPRPQTMQQPVAQSLSYGQTPANSQSLYGTQTGSQNNPQSLYGHSSLTVRLRGRHAGITLDLA